MNREKIQAFNSLLLTTVLLPLCAIIFVTLLLGEGSQVFAMSLSGCYGCYAAASVFEQLFFIALLITFPVALILLIVGWTFFYRRRYKRARSLAQYALVISVLAVIGQGINQKVEFGSVLFSIPGVGVL